MWNLKVSTFSQFHCNNFHVYSHTTGNFCLKFCMSKSVNAFIINCNSTTSSSSWHLNQAQHGVWVVCLCVCVIILTDTHISHNSFYCCWFCCWCWSFDCGMIIHALDFMQSNGWSSKRRKKPSLFFVHCFAKKEIYAFLWWTTALLNLNEKMITNEN